METIEQIINEKSSSEAVKASDNAIHWSEGNVFDIDDSLLLWKHLEKPLVKYLAAKKM